MIESKEKPGNFWSSERVNKLLKDAEENGIDYKDVDNPFYENDPEIRKGNILWEFTENELDEIKKCATDVIYFSNKYCHVMTDDGIQQIKLRDYQVQILNQYQLHRKNIFVSPRQSGKCFLPTTYIIPKDNRKVPLYLIFSNKFNMIWILKRFFYFLYRNI